MAIVPNRTSHFFNGVYNDLDKVGIDTSHLCMWRKGGEDQTQLVLNALEFSYDLIRGEDLVSDINPRSQIEAEHNIGSNIKTNVEQQYQNLGNLFPIIREQAGASYDQTFKALAGELGTSMSTGSDMDQIKRAKELITMGVKRNLKKMGRRFNIIASEALRTGKITLNDGSQYNFDRATANTGTVFATWDNSSTATPTADLVGIYEAIRDNGNCDPGFVGMGATAANSFFNTAEILALSDLRRSNFISAGGKDSRELPALPPGYQRMVDSGWKYQAWLKSFEGYEFYIFVNNANYKLVKGGSRINYQPKKDVLMMDPVAMRCDLYLGPKTRFMIDLPGQRAIESLFGISRLKTMPLKQTGTRILEPWMFNHDTWVNESRTFIGVESYTGPVTVPTAVDCAGSLPDATA
jgi:hypothetical protein